MTINFLDFTPPPALMPPESSAEFDIHLNQSVGMLADLSTSLTVDVFLSYCDDNVPGLYEVDRKVHPRRVQLDLEKAGFSW